MADESGPTSAPVAELERLEKSASESDFFQLLRRLEVLYRQNPRHGRAARPAEEPVRLGQRPSTRFAPTAVRSFSAGAGMEPPHRVEVAFLGLFGPNGPLPLVLTLHAEQRCLRAQRTGQDDPLVDLTDMFHHRALSLLYRAWASSRPVVHADRPGDNRFADYVSALSGEAADGSADRGLERERALHSAGLLACQTRHAEGLEVLAAELLETGVEIEPLVGEWLPIPAEYAWKLGEQPARHARLLGVLGESCVVGPEVYERQHKFRLVVGPTDGSLLAGLLSGGAKRKELAALVRSYVGDALRWDLRVILAEGVLGPLRLGEPSTLGETTYLLGDASDVIPNHLIDPFTD